MKQRANLSQRCMTALVFGTALSTLGVMPAEAQAVQDLSRYCTTCWKNARLQPDSWSDCTQQVLLRMLERVDLQRWEKVFAEDTAERREFLRAIDAVKKRTQRAHKHAPITVETPDQRTAERAQLDAQRQAVLAAASRYLSPRQADIIALSLDGWSVHEIASEMNLSPSRVSDEKYKAIRRLKRELQ